MRTAFALAICIALTTLTSPAPAHAQVGLPPAEYDHPFKGELIVVQAGSEAEVRKLCPPQPLPIALGCAYRTSDGSRCRIIVAPDSLIETTRYTPDIVRRHEIGHCNGWPANHPMTRTAGAPKPPDPKVGAMRDEIPAPKPKPTSLDIGPGAILVYKNHSWKFKGGDMSKIENWTVLTP